MLSFIWKSIFWWTSCTLTEENPDLEVAWHGNVTAWTGYTNKTIFSLSQFSVVTHTWIHSFGALSEWLGYLLQWPGAQEAETQWHMSYTMHIVDSKQNMTPSTELLVVPYVLVTWWLCSIHHCTANLIDQFLFAWSLQIKRLAEW